MLSERPIGHLTLLKRYQAAKQEILRMRTIINRRNETIANLKRELASKEVSNETRS